MSQFSHYEACPKCRSNGRDNRGDNLAVYRDGSVHCFSCGYHKFSVFNYWKNRKLKELNDGPKSLCPADYTRDVPAGAWKWLLQYGLPHSYWRDLVGYSPYECRLVFDVRTESGVAFRIGRYVGEEVRASDKSGAGGNVARASEGKERGIREALGRWAGSAAANEGDAGVQVGVLQQLHDVVGGPGEVGRSARPAAMLPFAGKPKKWFVWGDSHKHAEVIARGKTGYTVVVEDLVSAHKVGLVAEAIPLFGTRIYNPHFYYLINENKPVVLWLDKDQSQNVKKQALQLESVINQPVRILTTDKDPKAYSEQEINEFLKVSPP